MKKNKPKPLYAVFYYDRRKLRLLLAFNLCMLYPFMEILEQQHAPLTLAINRRSSRIQEQPHLESKFQTNKG